MRRQMELACRLKRPVSFHCRRAWEPLLKALDDLPLPSGFVVHSYSGSPELITEFCKRGGYISFSGSLTRSRNRRAQAACVATPEERLLIETDAPDMSPSIGDNPPETNVSNEPANLVHILQALANYRGQPLDRLAERTMRNARLLFRVDS